MIEKPCHNMQIRIEHDTMGEVKVDASKFWGAQTERSRCNFKIGTEKMPSELIHAFAHLKWAAAQANNQCGILSADMAKRIQKACDRIINEDLSEHFPLVVWQTGSGTQTNMNVNEVIAYIANIDVKDLKDKLHPNDHVNKSQSSNDSFPTAMHISAAISTHNMLIPALEKLHQSFIQKTDEFKSVLKIARTHLQDATPITVGQEFSGYARQLELSKERLLSVLPRLYLLAQGGTAVGTGINCPDQFPRYFNEILEHKLGIPFKPSPNFYEALATHDTLVEFSGVLNVIAVGLMKIANDIRLLGSGPRCGLNELYLPENEPGSSIMPGKVNPTQAEAMTMVCAQVMGNHATVSIAGSQGHLELNVFKPVIALNLLQSIRLLSDAMNSFAQNCIDGISVNTKVMKQNIENSLMLVTALNPIVGYENAAKIAKHALKENISLKQAALTLNLISSDAFDDAMVKVLT